MYTKFIFVSCLRGASFALSLFHNPFSILQKKKAIWNHSHAYLYFARKCICRAHEGIKRRWKEKEKIIKGKKLANQRLGHSHIIFLPLKKKNENELFPINFIISKRNIFNLIVFVRFACVEHQQTCICSLNAHIGWL